MDGPIPSHRLPMGAIREEHLGRRFDGDGVLAGRSGRYRWAILSGYVAIVCEGRWWCLDDMITACQPFVERKREMV